MIRKNKSHNDMFGEMSYRSPLRLIAAAVALCGVLGGCQKKEYSGSADGEGMLFSVSDASQDLSLVQSKSAPDSLVLTGGDGTYRLALAERITPTQFATAKPQVTGSEETKGAPVTGKNIKERYAENLIMSARESDGTTEFIPQQPLSYVRDKSEGSNVTIWKPRGTYSWPDRKLVFWSWAPGENVSNVNYGEKTVQFSYLTPHSGGAGKDAEFQSDLIVAGTTAGKDETVHLQFAHALSSIRFEIGKTNDMTVQSISLRNVSSTGTCTATLATEATKADEVSKAPTVAWSNLGSRTDYTQNFVTEIKEYLIDNDNTQQVDKSEDRCATFMVIPQSSTAEQKLAIEMVFRLKGTDQDITVSAELSPAKGWQPGLTYTYVLSIVNGLDIEIDDKVEDNVKKDLQISNVGGRDAYIRALVVGYWVNTAGDIVALWDPNDANVGTFVPNIFASTPVLNEHWVKGADGFFYYKRILPGKTAIPADKTLFTTYTVKPEGKPKNLKLSDHLEIDIVTQAVVVDAGKAAITTAWGATAAGYMTE